MTTRKKPKKKKINKKKLTKQFYYMMVTLMVCLTFYGFYTFGVGMYNHSLGFHNVDLGHNIQKLNDYYNMTLMDRGTDGEIWTGVKAYETGWNQIHDSLFQIIKGACVFCISLMCLCSEVFYGRE